MISSNARRWLPKYLVEVAIGSDLVTFWRRIRWSWLGLPGRRGRRRVNITIRSWKGFSDASEKK
jgi:hypothetical protein